MRHLFITIFCLLLLNAATAQKNRQVRSVVVDIKERLPVTDATVTLYRGNDTLPYDHTLTNKEGAFHFKKLDDEQYSVFITATGHVPVKKEFQLSAGGTGLPDTLFMSIAYKQEDTVVVRGLVVPVIVKKDTLEFNPAAFKTPEDEAIEELIKKIPGFSIDETDGSLKYNGEEVKQIMVDGKPFSLDPSLPITKILPVHVIDKIQLIDQRPKEEKFNKNDNGVREKVLNLTIKKNKKRGWLARASLSAGSNNLWDANANATRLNNDRKILANLRGGNAGQNVNGGVNSGQINPGRNRNLSFGVGYTDAWKKNNQLSMNGGYNSNSNENFNNSVRTTFLPGDTSLIAVNQSQSSNSNEGKNFSVQYNKEVEDKQHFSFEGSYYSNTGTSFRKAATETNNNFKSLVNTYANTTSGRSKSEQFSGNVSYSRQIDTFGCSFSIRANWQSSGNNNNQFAVTQNIFFEDNGNIKRKDSLDQQRKNTGGSDNRQLFLGYNTPVFKKYFLNLNYGVQWSENRSLINVYDLDDITDKYDRFNDSLSNGFNNSTLTHNASFSIGGNNKKGLSYSLRMGIRQQSTENRNFDSVNILKQRFLNFTPSFNINYFKKDRPSIRFNYSGQTNQPSIQQRQPVIDNTHPLYLRLGNPDLRPEYSNQASLNISRSFIEKSINYSANINFSNTFNKITESVSFDREGRQVTRPVNLSGAYSAALWSSFGYPISKRKKHHGGITMNLRRGKSVSVVNEQRNIGRDLFVGSGLNATVGIEKWLDVTGGVNYTYSEIIYQSATRGNIVYNSLSTSLKTTARIPGDWEINSLLDYVNRGSRVQYGRETTIWNMAVSKKFFKKQLVCSFRVQDLLQQQISYSRNIGINYIEESQNAVIGRYYMLTVSYQLNKFGGKK